MEILKKENCIANKMGCKEEKINIIDLPFICHLQSGMLSVQYPFRQAAKITSYIKIMSVEGLYRCGTFCQKSKVSYLRHLTEIATPTLVYGRHLVDTIGKESTFKALLASVYKLKGLPAGVHNTAACTEDKTHRCPALDIDSLR